MLKNTSGYKDIVFDGKKAQAQSVEEIVSKSGFVPSQLVHNEVAWLCVDSAFRAIWWPLQLKLDSTAATTISASVRTRSVCISVPFVGLIPWPARSTDDQYFRMESADTVAEHVTSLYGAKILAWSRHQKQLEINLEKVTDETAVYIHSSMPGVSDPKSDHERRCVRL